MPLSAKIKNLLAAPFAISRIMQKFAVPGLVGVVLFGIGRWQDLAWLQITGMALAAPIAWVYALVIFIFIPFAIFDWIRAFLRKGAPGSRRR